MVYLPDAEERMSDPMGPCLCGASDCSSCGPLVGDPAHPALLEELCLRFHWLDKLSENEQDELATWVLERGAELWLAEDAQRW